METIMRFISTGAFCTIPGKKFVPTGGEPISSRFAIKGWLNFSDLVFSDLKSVTSSLIAIFA